MAALNAQNLKHLGHDQSGFGLRLDSPCWETLTTCTPCDFDVLSQSHDSTVEFEDLAQHVLSDHLQFFDDHDSAHISENKFIPHLDHVRTPLMNALISEPIHPADPRNRTPQAKAALEKELKGLRDRGCWDESNPIEAEQAKKQFPDAQFATLFAINVIKNAESQDERDHEYRSELCSVVTTSGTPKEQLFSLETLAVFHLPCVPHVA